VTPSVAPSRVVIFRVGAQFYGMDVMGIERVIRYATPRPIPLGSTDVSGVMEVDGRLLPVIDLRERLGGSTPSDASMGRVLLVRDGSELVGLAVDQVLDVRVLEDSDIEPAPSALARGAGPVIFSGTLRRGAEVVLLVVPDALIAATRPHAPQSA
jgi:purine-binding chemotaxis protein CheW